MTLTGLAVNTSDMRANASVACMAQDVGDRLKAARKARAMSRRDVAERLTVSVAAIQHHESGQNDPSLSNLAKYARIYRISTDWIITGKGKGPLDARDPREAVLEVFDAIPEAQQPQALAILQALIGPEKRSA